MERWLRFLEPCLEAEGAGGSGGGSEGGDSGNDNANAGGDGGQDSGDKQFTQADVDRIVGERAKRAGDSAVAKLLETLGFTKPDELKAVVKAHKDAEEANKSELQKLADAQKTADEAKSKAEAERDEARTERDGLLIRHEIELAAVEAGFANPRDAYELLVADESMSEVEISEAGKVSGYEKALKALAESGRLPMREGKTGSGLGTPQKKQQRPAPKGEQTGGAEQQAAPVVRF